MDIKPIRSKADYERALGRVEELWDSAEGSTESDEVDILSPTVETGQAQERRKYRLGPFDALGPRRFRQNHSALSSFSTLERVPSRSGKNVVQSHSEWQQIANTSRRDSGKTHFSRCVAGCWLAPDLLSRQPQEINLILRRAGVIVLGFLDIIWRCRYGTVAFLFFSGIVRRVGLQCRRTTNSEPTD